MLVANFLAAAWSVPWARAHVDENHTQYHRGRVVHAHEAVHQVVPHDAAQDEAHVKVHAPDGHLF